MSLGGIFPTSQLVSLTLKVSVLPEVALSCHIVTGRRLRWTEGQAKVGVRAGELCITERPEMSSLG